MASTIRQHSGAGLVAAALIGAAFAQGLFEPNGYAGASIAIWAALAAGLTARTLPTGPVGRLAAAAGLCLAATAVLAIASIAWAADQGRAYQEAVRVSFYVGLFALAACTANRGSRAQWLAGLAAGLGVVVAIAVFAYLLPGILHSGGSDVPGSTGRLSYPVGYWNGAGALMATAVVLLVHYGASGPQRLLRAVATAIIPIAALGIWLTSSRGGAAAAVIALGVLVATSRDRPRLVVTVGIASAGAVALIAVAAQLDALTTGVVDSAMRADGRLMAVLCLVVAALTGVVSWLAGEWRPRPRISRRMWIGLAAVAVAGVVVAVIAVDPAARISEFKAPPPARAGVPVGAAGVSSNGRWQFWGQALDAFESAPAGGVGAGGFESWWGRHATAPLFVRNPHSLPLQSAAELGAPGFLLLLGFVGAVAVAARRRLAEGLGGDGGLLIAIVVAGAVGAAFDWTWEIPAVFGPAVVCAGLLTASAAARPLARNGYWLGLGTVAAAWIAMIAAGLVVLEDLELQRSRDAASANRISDAIDSARAAHTVQPWSAEPYTQLALLEEQRGDLGAALADLARAQTRDSEDWRLALIEASLLQRRGDLAAARVAYARAQRLSPVPLATVLLAQETQG